MTGRAASPGADPAVLAEQVLACRVSPEALQWLAAGFALFDRNDGTLPLERCLGLPTRAQRQRRKRDYLVREVARLLPGEAGSAALAARLGAELDAFMRGPWCEWRQLADPPLAASPLQSALFRVAATFKAGRRPCDKQLQAILRRQKFFVLETSAKPRQDASPSPPLQPRATP